MSGSADRNLLFGILALQMDFISRDALIAAMHAWVIDKAKTLGAILQEEGHLSAERLQLLDALVAEHLKTHGDDAQQSLASLSSVSSLRQALRDLDDPDLHASLDLAGSARSPESTVDDVQQASPRYRVLRPHAKGGLGEVFVAEDQELHREVALKEIRQHHAHDPQSRGRFLLEAEITGGLEHPGIVPVYGLGTYGDGRPFYAMRFIHGDNLKEAIRRFHVADTPGRDPGARSLALRQLLGRFVDVCQAVAYAHSRGVLHRDLKPGNIMLGPYGETLVVDWGLAKAVGRALVERDGDERTLKPSSGSQVAATQAGSALGTPAYMSPEQAAGRLEELGPATDVYSLGATLYQLLTGRRPVEGEDIAAVLAKVRRGEIVPPRQVKKDVPAALQAICLKALALQPEERYPTALALAADVEHWLADEPVTAHCEPWALRARRWARRHKPLVSGLAALLLTALLLGGGFGLWWKQQRDALIGAVQEQLDRAEQLRDAEQWDQARQAVDRAEARLAGGDPVGLHQRMQALREQLDMVRQLHQARMQGLAIVDGKQDLVGADRAYQKVFARLGLNPLGLDATSAAEQITQTPLSKQLVAALDDWAIAKYRLGSRDGDRLLAVARLVDDDPWRQQLRDPSVRKDSAKLQRLAKAKDVLTQPPANLRLLSRFLKGAQSPETAEQLLRQAQLYHPSDFWIAFELGTHLHFHKSSNKEEVISCYRTALALQPQSGTVYNNLGMLLDDQKKPVEAEVAYRKAIELQPNDHLAWNNLGLLLMDQKKRMEAEAAFRKAIQLQPDDAYFWINLGRFLQKEQKKPVEAEAASRKALELQPGLADAWNNLGTILIDQGRWAEAEAAIRKALELQPDFAMAWNNFGTCLARQPKLAEAEAAIRKALELQPNHAPAWNNLGRVLVDQQKPAEAEAAIRKALELQPDFALAWINLGRLRALQDKPDQEEAAYRKALEFQPNNAELWYSLGFLLTNQRKLTEAEAAYRKALECQPDYAEAHISLGMVLRYQGRFAESVASIQKGHDLGSRNPAWRYPSDQWVRRAEREIDLDPKLPAILKGERKPTTAAEQIELARLCSLPRKQLYAASTRFYRDGFAAEPKSADDLHAGERYNAACSAALAGCGQGKDADQTDNAERAHFREQALTWLRADLAAWTAHLKDNPEKTATGVRQKMQHWQHDADLAGVRDADALAKLADDERQRWQQLWAEVETLRQRAAAPQK